MKKILLSLVSVMFIAGASAQVNCDIANIQGGFAGGYLDWSLGESGLYAFIDPAGDYPVGQGCEATYPYTIETVSFALAASTAFGVGTGTGTFGYQINIYAVDGDACNEPGALIGGSGTITADLTGTALNPQNIEINIDVNDAFFVSYEPVSWTGPVDQVPSILWDAAPRPECVQFVTDDGGATFVDFTEYFTGGETGWADFNIFGSSETGSGGGCETGDLTNAAIEELCPDESTEIASVIPVSFPVGGGAGILLTPGMDGEGGLDDEFILTGVTFPYDLNAGLNGVLAANSLPDLSGTWEISIAVYSSTAAPIDNICAQSDVKTVVFLDASDPACDSGVEPGDECATWVNPTPTTGWTDFNSEGGAPCNDGDGCPFIEIDDFEVWQSEAYQMINVQEGGVYTFSHCNGPGAGSWVPEYTIIAPSGVVDAFGEGNGDGCSITWTASESGTYLVVINEAGACGVEGNTDNGFPAITCEGSPDCEPSEGCEADIPHDEDDECVQIVIALDPFCCETEWDAQCEDAYQTCLSGGGDCLTWVNPTPESGWSDFNTSFDGAPTPDADGVCDFFEIQDFEVWQSEAYAMDNIQQGVEYTFSHCNGSGAGSWTPTYVIVAPSGAIDAEGLGNGDGCSISWVASESGTYLIGINDVENCGIAGNTDNGFPAITCSGSSSVNELSAVSFNVFPNPNNGEFTINYTGQAGLVQVDVLDISGKTVYGEQVQLNSNTVMEINLGDDARGMYFVRMLMNDEVSVLKVVVQ